MRKFLLCFLLVVSAQSANANCYTWTNEAPQQVVIIFSYLDANLSPIGQPDRQPLLSGRNIQRCTTNQNMNVTLLNGAYNGWSPSTIFGNNFHPPQDFIIASNADVLNIFGNPTPQTTKMHPSKRKVSSKAIISVTLNAEFIVSGELHQIQITDMVCNRSLRFNVLGGNQYSYDICADDFTGFGRISMRDLTTNSGSLEFGQITAGTSLSVP